MTPTRFLGLPRPPRSSFRSVALAAALALLCGAPFDAAADDPPAVAAADASRAASPWDVAFTAFAVDDATRPRPPGGVLFVGSSSIRLWNDLEDQFKNLPVVIKRGFGGSQLSDCVKHLNRLVVR